jgi:hypothetical protein
LQIPLRKKYSGKKKNFKRSKKNKVKILSLLNLYLLFREEHKQKRLLKKQEKTRGQDFVLVLSLQLSLRENTSKKASESEARKFPRI